MPPPKGRNECGGPWGAGAYQVPQVDLGDDNNIIIIPATKPNTNPRMFVFCVFPVGKSIKIDKIANKKNRYLLPRRGIYFPDEEKTFVRTENIVSHRRIMIRIWFLFSETLDMALRGRHPYLDVGSSIHQFIGFGSSGSYWCKIE